MSKSIIPKLCVALFAAICISGCQLGPTDEELITNTMNSWKTAMLARSIDGIMKNYSEEFTSQNGQGKQQVKGFIESVIEQGYLDDVEIDIETADIRIEDDTAVVDPVNFTFISGETMTLTLTLQKEKNVWLIKKSSNTR